MGTEVKLLKLNKKNSLNHNQFKKFLTAFTV